MHLNQNTAPPSTSWNKARSPFIRYPGQGSPSSVVKPLQLRARVRAKQQYINWLTKQRPDLVKKAREVAAGQAAPLQGFTPLVPRYSQDMNVRRITMGQFNPPATVPEEEKSWWDKLTDTVTGAYDKATAPVATATGTDAKVAAEEGWLDKLIGATKEIAPAYLQFQQQKEIMDMQVQRAKQGLPPLDTSFVAPTVKIQADIGSGITKLALPLLAIGGIALLIGRRKGRR